MNRKGFIVTILAALGVGLLPEDSLRGDVPEAPPPLCLWCEDEGLRDLVDGRRISPCDACGQSPPAPPFPPEADPQMFGDSDDKVTFTMNAATTSSTVVWMQL